ncbi:hypothetical protein DFH28DRAFT_1215908 [Melampsora americana]|nr:hypothetical protein DFH28DRAFT_1215908 [Melampsora americana]
MIFLYSSLVSIGMITIFLPVILTFSEQNAIIRPLIQEGHLSLNTPKDAKSSTGLSGRCFHFPDLQSPKVLRKGFDEIRKNFEKPGPQVLSATSWSKYYEIAHKVANQEDHLVEIQRLASHIRDLGPDFTNRIFDKRAIKEHIIPPIQNAYVTLQNDRLGDKERVWAVGVLSCLLYKSENREKGFYSKRLKGIDTLRGDREVFFLKDLPVAEVAEKMWLHPDQNTEEFIQILEALGRASAIASIERDIPKFYKPPFDAFQSIFLSFIRLDTPMNPEKALDLTEQVKRYILRRIDQSEGILQSPDEKEKNAMRMLFHMVKYHERGSQEIFDDLIFRPLGLFKALQSDILIQHEGLKLSPHLENVFTPFKNIINIEIRHILEALKSLTVYQTTQNQWGKLYSILALFVQYDNRMYEHLDRGLGESPKLVSDILTMLEKHRPTAFHPAWATSSTKWKSLESILQRKEREHNAWKHFKDLQDILIEKGFLSSNYISGFSEVLSMNGKVPDRKLQLIKLLNAILAKISGDQGEFSDPKVQNLIIEYTLLLISLRDERRGVLDFYFPMNRPLPIEISSKAFQEIQEWSGFRPGQETPESLYNLEIFLHGLEKLIEKAWGEMKVEQKAKLESSSADFSNTATST